MTTSDIYYTRINSEYSLWQKDEQLSGVVSNVTIHHDYSYIEINNRFKRLIRPALNANRTEYFSDRIELGDSVSIDPSSSKITIYLASKSYSYKIPINYREIVRK
jgi:galactokinase/mevalonate kinase-like predicted kinase